VQVLPIVKGVRLFGYLDGTVSEPASTDVADGAWVAQDQQIIGFINASLSQEVLGHVATCTTATAVWKELNSMFASQSCAHTIQLGTQLATTSKGDQFDVVYYNKMKGFADRMAATGKPLEDVDFVAYLLLDWTRITILVWRT
jgi:hypothetical protein